MSRRWVCPTCDAGVLGPDRPRRDDVRRYCLDCSATTGRLVERTCPALEKRREAKAVKAKATRAAKAERAAAAELARRTAGPYDLLAEAKRFAKLPTFTRLRAFPEIEFRRSKTKTFTSGRCRYSDGRIIVTVGLDDEGAVATMLHEMVHALCRYEGHSQRFWDTLRRAAREAWPDATFDFAHTPNGWQTDRAVARGLRALAGRDVAA